MKINLKKGLLALTGAAILITGFTISIMNNPSPKPVDTKPPVNNFVDTVDNYRKNNPTIFPTPTGYPSHNYTDNELRILAIIIYQEAGADNCSDDTRRKVGSVFLNRVKSKHFPDTFEEVALQRKQYGTLYWTGITWPARASYPQELHAVKRAYTIAEELLSSGSVLPDNVVYQAEFPQGDGTYCYQDEIYFGYMEVNK